MSRVHALIRVCRVQKIARQSHSRAQSSIVESTCRERCHAPGDAHAHVTAHVFRSSSQ